MIIIGITGSIGMGKTTVSNMLRILRKTISDKNKLSKSFNFIEFNILFFSLLGFAGLFLNYFHYDESLIHLKIIDFLRNASFRNPHGIEIPFGKIFYFKKK